MATVNQLQELILSKLPATGGISLTDFEASLPPADVKPALQLIQPLKLGGKLATWLEVGDDGKATAVIGRKDQAPAKPKNYGQGA